MGFDMGVKMLVSTLSTFDDTRATYLKGIACKIAGFAFHIFLICVAGRYQVKQRCEQLAGSCTGGSIELLPKFMNEDDEAFGAELFEFVIQNRDKYRALIDGFILFP